MTTPLQTMVDLGMSVSDAERILDAVDKASRAVSAAFLLGREIERARAYRIAVEMGHDKVAAAIISRAE